MNDQNQDAANNQVPDQGGQPQNFSGREEVEKLKEELSTVTNSWKRAAADYQNLQKRVEKEKEEWLKFANASLLGKLLGVLDNLQRAQEHLGDEGLTMVVKNFTEVLSQQGLREIKVAVGDDFDPNLEECVEVVKAETDGKVVEVIGKGYIIEEKVLRPAKVKVSRKETEKIPPEAEKEMEAGDYV